MNAYQAHCNTEGIPANNQPNTGSSVWWNEPVYAPLQDGEHKTKIIDFKMVADTSGKGNDYIAVTYQIGNRQYTRNLFRNDAFFFVQGIHQQNNTEYESENIIQLLQNLKAAQTEFSIWHTTEIVNAPNSPEGKKQVKNFRFMPPLETSAPATPAAPANDDDSMDDLAN